MNERFEMLIKYLGELRLLNEESYTCTDEIAECISEIRDVLQVENKVAMANKPVYWDAHMNALEEHKRFMENNIKEIKEQNTEANNFHSKVSEKIRERQEQMQKKKRDKASKKD